MTSLHLCLLIVATLISIVTIVIPTNISVIFNILFRFRARPPLNLGIFSFSISMSHQSTKNTMTSENDSESFLAERGNNTEYLSLVVSTEFPKAVRISSSEISLATTTSLSTLYPNISSEMTVSTSGYDMAAVARLPEESELSSLGMTVDDDIIEKQEAIMRDLLKESKCKREPNPLTAVYESHSAIAPPPSIITPPSQQDEFESPYIDKVGDFCDYMNDPELIREQRRIFEGIQRQAQQAEADNLDLLPNSRSRNPVDSLTDQVLEASMQHSIHRSSVSRGAAATQVSDSKTSPPSDNAIAASFQDRVTRLENGKKLRVKGTQHTYHSIARGTAILVTCPCCSTVLQVDASTKNVYCLRCQQVSPMELARGGGGSDTDRDSNIAGSVQRQEIDVACARKISKMNLR